MTDNPRFVDNGNGTITDTQTGLVWAREDSWQAETRWVSWDEALQYSQDLAQRRFAGRDDWRLPSEKEALTLVASTQQNKDKYGNALFLDPVFPPGPLATFWTQEGIGNDAFVVNLATGQKSMLYKSKSGRMAARPVRGAPWEG